MESYNSRVNYISFLINTVVAFSVGLVASFSYALISDFQFEILLLCVLTLILSSLLLLSLHEIKLQNLRLKKPPRINKTEIKAVLVEEILNSFRQCGFVKNSAKEDTVKKLLLTSAYIRGQNIYYMLHHGMLKVKSRVLFINDHPFKPFSDLVNLNMPKGADYRGVGAFPDELYSKEDINRRIEIIKDHDSKYYFLPDQDVNVAVVIFDDDAALIYSTPETRTVCNFSEGLLVTDKAAIKEVIKFFNHLYGQARRRSRGNLPSVIDELGNLSAFYVGPPKSDPTK